MARLLLTQAGVFIPITKGARQPYSNDWDPSPDVSSRYNGSRPRERHQQVYALGDLLITSQPDAD